MAKDSPSTPPLAPASTVNDQWKGNGGLPAAEPLIPSPSPVPASYASPKATPETGGYPGNSKR